MKVISPNLTILAILFGVLVYYLKINFYQDLDEIILKTKLGEIKGLVSKSRGGRLYSSFRGIPYAQPPVGKLRFQSPVPPGPWEGIRDGSQNPPICTQANVRGGSLEGQEDCLYLNVHTPKTFRQNEPETMYPVLFFIHGGYFMHGSQDIFGPQYFVDEDVVIVTLNYRLGALGFLNTGLEATGNMGLKDQVMALNWVQAGIQDFGGDPESVTIFGESAGGAFVNYHLLSPLSKGLFKNAISQSGTSLCGWALSKDPKQSAKLLGQKLNCPSGNTQDLMKCLLDVDAGKIAEANFALEDPFHGHEVIFGPSVEYDTGADIDKFLAEDPREASKGGRIAQVPWMLGVNSHEGCFRSAVIINNEAKVEELARDWNTIVPRSLLFVKDDNVSSHVQEFYFGKDKKTFTIEDYQNLTDMYSDRAFFLGTRNAARYHARHSPAYLYYMSYKSGRSFGHALACSKGKVPILIQLLLTFLKEVVYSKLGWKYLDYGVCHADELQYLFSTVSFWEISQGSQHYEFSKEMVKVWVSFAKHGRPVDFKGTKWESVSPTGETKYMHLSIKPEMAGDVLFKGRLDFWDSLHFFDI